MPTYKKICKSCGNTFESESCNTLYCSDKCAKKGAKKAYRSRKMKHINAVRRGDDKELETLISIARKVSQEVANLCICKVCGCKDKNHICDGDQGCHQIDHNVFNIDPSNLIWLCEKAHHEIHSTEEDCSVIDEMKSYIVILKQSDIRKRNK